MMNFDTELDRAGVTRMSVATAVTVTDEVTYTPLRPQPFKSDAVAKADAGWQWDDLRDYVVAKIEEHHGPFPRDSKKESGIFKSFLSRYGEMAPVIARYAFEVCNGRWREAPISVTRFCKASDPYFADIIVARLAEVSPRETW